MIGKFFQYVELKTKITSTFAFLLAIVYLLYQRQSIGWSVTVLFFASMFLFDLTTTAINNYIDTKTDHQALQFKRKTSKVIIYILLALSILLGLLLVYYTDFVVLMVGSICFLCGIMYTYGPISISRQPLGELLSGIFYGLLIPFLVLYINMPAGTYMTLSFDIQTIALEFKVIPLITLALLSVTPACTTANIMLANNIRDLDRDIKIKRHTVPYYLGDNAYKLFALLYYITYLAMIIMVIVHILPPICLLSLFTIFVVHKNIKTFIKAQDKDAAFIIAIKNYVIIMGANVAVVYLGSLIR